MEGVSPESGPRLLALLGLLGASFLFSASEPALFSLSPLDLAGLRKDRPRDFEKLSRLLDRPRLVLITLLLGNELANVGASAIATSLVIERLGQGYRWVAAAVMFPTLLFACELTPKMLAARHRVKASLLVRPLLLAFFVPVSPAVYALKALVDRVMALVARRAPRAASGLDEKTFKRLVQRATREGSLTPHESHLVESVFALGDVDVSEVWTPRERVFALPLATSYEDLLYSFKEREYRRIPVYLGDPGQIVGVVHIKDLLRAVAARKVKETGSLRPVLRRPLFVPARLRLDEVFTRLNREQTHMAFVRHEGGEFLGLVTMDDILNKLLARVSGQAAPLVSSRPAPPGGLETPPPAPGGRPS